IGVDLKKDHQVIEAAYDDSSGVTARFNLNLLHHLNRRFGLSLPVGRFRHLAYYNQEEGRVEMHLMATEPISFEVGGQAFELDRDETIRTEVSYKYSPEEFRRIAEAAGFELERVWTDERRYFSLQCLRVPAAPR
ncbi:MAG: L-histidine N(alpha)-methyltransferase, partial [Myxococcales bacterium]|nr:L-histidine N(alpha)-methyltransferase [Myxococcales bacterium]